MYRMVQEIDRSATTAADAATVYALLRDGATWPTWSPLGSFELERPAAPDDPEGVGAVRHFRTGRTHSHEEIVELVPDRRLSYVLLAGLPLRDYRADVDLTPQGDGTTRIRWHSTFKAKVPGTGWFYRLVLGRFVGQVVDGLAAYAARRPATVST